MRVSRLAGIVASLAVIGIAMPAAAQGLPIEMMLRPPKRPANLAPPAPAAPAIPAPGAVDSAALAPQPAAPRPRLLTPAPLPATFTAAKPAAPAAPAAPEPVATASAPPAAPPAPPAQAVAAAPKPAAPKPITMAAATPEAAVAAVRAEPLDERAIVERANAYFTNLNTLVADFTQIGGDGRRLGGTLYLQRPGKVRFEYDKPATLEVIADGSSVAVRDTKLATQDLYSISQTPLKFLLRERVNLGQDIKITGIANDGDAVRIALEDRSTLGGTSKITLFFDPKVETLNQWRIVDPQGFQTTVMLNKIERGQRVDQRLFVINYDRAISNDNTSR